MKYFIIGIYRIFKMLLILPIYPFVFFIDFVMDIGRNDIVLNFSSKLCDWVEK